MTSVSATLERLRPPAARTHSARELALWAGGWLLFWAVVIAVAIKAAPYAEANPRLVAAPAAFIVTTLACMRFPLAALLVLVGFTAFGFSITAFLGFAWSAIFELVLVGMILATVARLLSKRRGTVRVWPGAALLLLFIVLSLFQTVPAAEAEVAQAQFRQTHLLLGAALVVAYMPLSRSSVEWLVRGLVLIGLAVGAYATLRYFIGPAAEETQYARHTAGRYFIVDGEQTLIGSAGASHPFSAWLAPVIPFLAVCAVWLRGSWRWLALAGAGLCMFALLGTEVRSGFAGAVAGTLTAFGVLLAAAASGGRRYVMAYAAAVACVAGVAIVAASIPSEEERDGRPPSRYAAILDPSQDQAFQERLYRWENAKDEILTKPLGHGVGLSGERGKRLVRFVQIEGRIGLDNSYLKLAYEQGLLMAVLFLLALFAILAALVRYAMTATYAGPAFLAVASIGALVAYGLKLNFESIYIEIRTVLLFGILVGLGMRGLSRPQDEPVRL